MLHNQWHLKLFEDKGLHRICGSNVTVAENDVGALPYEMMIDALTDLTSYFVKPFDFPMQQAKVKSLNTDTQRKCTSGG